MPNIEVPMIGQQNQALATIRYQLAATVMAQLAVTDYSTMMRIEMDKADAIGEAGEGIELNLNVGMVSSAAVAYADGLLKALGIAR